MSSCCASAGEPTPKPVKRACPVCNNRSSVVRYSTILQHLDQPWKHAVRDQTYYFCADAQCEVVYFDKSDAVIMQSALRTEIGIKSDSPAALICYCYGVIKAQARNEPEAKAFVLAQTKAGRCACEVRNPSGRCCLKDFREV